MWRLEVQSGKVRKQRFLVQSPGQDGKVSVSKTSRRRRPGGSGLWSRRSVVAAAIRGRCSRYGRSAARKPRALLKHPRVAGAGKGQRGRRDIGDLGRRTPPFNTTRK